METKDYIFISSIIMVIALFLFNPEKGAKAIQYSGEIIIKIIPALVLVIVIMALFDYYISPRAIARHLGKDKPIRAWLISSVMGIISTGPIYLWYPMLADARDKGASNSSIAIFLYNRAVKPALLPLMIYYFGLKFTILLTLFTILFSGLNGFLVEKLMEVKI